MTIEKQIKKIYDLIKEILIIKGQNKKKREKVKIWVVRILP